MGSGIRLTYNNIFSIVGGLYLDGLCLSNTDGCQASAVSDGGCSMSGSRVDSIRAPG